MGESQDETLRRQQRNAKSLSRARQQQGHVAHQHVRSNRRLDERDGVRFEEAQTPAHGQNTYLREVTPDGLLLPDEAERLHRRRAKRVADARVAADRAANRAPTPRDIESRATSEEALEEAAIASRVETEKAALLRKGVSEPDAVLIIREHHAVELGFDHQFDHALSFSPINYTQDSALMYMWRRKKERQLEPSVITSLIRRDKSECAEKRYQLTDDLHRLKEEYTGIEYEQWAAHYVQRYEKWKADRRGWVAGHASSLMRGFQKEILSDLGLISGKVREEFLRDGHNRRFLTHPYGGFSVSDGHKCPVPHFFTDAYCQREARVRNPDWCRSEGWLLSSTVSAGDFSRCLQKYDVDTSPYLKSFFFHNERPGMLVRPNMRGAVILPDDEPAFVGVLAAARLVLRLQRIRTADDAVLNFDGSFSSETIERTKFRLFVKARRRLAHIKEEKSRRRNPLRLCQSAFESEFGLPPGCTRRLDDIVGGIAKHNLRNRRLRAGGKPLADSYRHVRIANSLVDSGNMNLITAFRWRSHKDIEDYLKEIGAGYYESALFGRLRLLPSVQVVWSLLADLVLSVEAEIERRSPMPLRPFLHV